MDAMGRESKWEMNKGGVALMWRGGCIIRSVFVGKLGEVPRAATPSWRTCCSTPISAAKSTAKSVGWMLSPPPPNTGFLPPP